jgi:hypothetical protein
LPFTRWGTGEDLEAVLARNCDQRHAGGLGHAHGKCRRRRNCGYCRRADHRRLLHHLDQDAARQHHQTLARAHVTTGESADELVERVMAPDILAQSYEPAIGLIDAGGMHRARLVVQRLHGGERLDGSHDLFRSEHTAFADFGRWAHRLGEALDAA